MNKKLDHLEARIQKLIEQKLVELVTGRRPSESLVTRLLRAMQDNLKQGPEGSMIAPDQYILHVNPEDLLDWQTHQEGLDQIAVLLHEQGELEGFVFPDEPSLTILSDPKTTKNEFTITALFSKPKTALPDTTAMPPSEPIELSNRIPEDAYLITPGSNNFPLEKMIINIGRHSENDLVLNDLHISRHHAQLRVINQNYVLFDVGSTGGLFLNGKKTTQATLQSGDVIRIGRTKLIYVQESPPEGPTTALPIDSESKS